MAKKKKQETGNSTDILKELFQAAVNLRGTIEPADYKRYVLPIIFLRFLSLRFENRREELIMMVNEPKSEYHTANEEDIEEIITDPVEYEKASVFMVPETASWDYLLKHAQADTIKTIVDDALNLLEKTYPDKLRGLLPRIFAGSNLQRENVTDLINLFSKDIFRKDHGGVDMIGRVYEYFIGEFASSEGKRGGEYFTPSSIVRCLVNMLEPEQGSVFDPCCGSGGMFVQSDMFTQHNRKLSFYGQESKDFTYRLCRMNLFIHGIDGKIELGNSYFDDKHATLKADYIIANPPFNNGSKGENGWGADRIPNKDPRLKTKNGKEIESKHPVLNDSENIIIIADEAHRTQYGFDTGFARYLYEALPNASRVGFTGTPISFSGADTIEVFGELIHTYDIKQSQEDGATVPIYYVPRQIKLKLSKDDIDKAFAEITDEIEIENFELKKSKWTALAAAAGAKERLAVLAKNLCDHYINRSASLRGKAIAVCMTRENCVKLYNALTSLPHCPEVKIIMTGKLGKDPEAWSKAGHLTTKKKREAIKERMRDIDDPLKIVIVCDMWLTGTDIPCLHTLYIDKPMKGHTMIQAISRVNRIFKDKPHGILIDYIGIGDELREATKKYTRGGGTGTPAPDIEKEAIPLFLACLGEVRSKLPGNIDYGDWRSLGHIDLEDRFSLIFGLLTESDDYRDDFLQLEYKLSKAFLLVKNIDECNEYIDEVIFYQRVRKEIRKTLKSKKAEKEIERAIKDLVDDSIDSEGVVDIYKIAGLNKPDISILDDDFLQTFKNNKNENLRIKLLEKLLEDEIKIRKRKNVAKAVSFKDLLQKTITKYHNRIIDAAKVIEEMIKIRNEMENMDKQAKKLGLSEEEYAFYSSVAENYENIYKQKFLCHVIHEVVRALKRNLKVDWTEPHRADVKAGIISAVKNVLRKMQIKREDRDALISLFIVQAEALYKNWPSAA